MLEKEVLVQLASGIHARPAAQFVKLCNSFQSDIRVLFKAKTLNGKSMMEMMTAAVPKDSTVMLKIDGVDEEAALATLEKYLSDVTPQ